MIEFEREEQELEDAYARGELSNQEFNKLMNQLQRDEREERRERAQKVYDRELERW